MLAEPAVDSELKKDERPGVKLWSVPEIWQNIAIAFLPAFFFNNLMEPQDLQKETGEQGGLEHVDALG